MQDRSAKSASSARTPLDNSTKAMNPAELASPSKDFDAVHSEQNILQWKEYLPQDCIETMIRLGWDCST